MAIFESLKPNYAWAQQVPADDKRIKVGYEVVPSPAGNGSIKGYLARPAKGKKLPVVLVIHENRGLNPYIEDVARRFALANFIAFAPDGLTSVGGYPGSDEKGASAFRTVDGKKMTVLEMKAHQLAWAILRVERMYKQAWAEAQSPAKAPMTTQPTANQHP